MKRCSQIRLPNCAVFKILTLKVCFFQYTQTKIQIDLYLKMTSEV